MKKTLAFVLTLLMLFSLTASAFAAGEEAAARGFSYLRGEGIAQDYGQAMACFQEAEQEGSTEVLFPMGEMYEYGTGVKKDLVSAVKYYVKASDVGVPEAQEKLQNEPYKSIAEAMSIQDQATHVTGTYGDVEGVRGPTYPYYLDYPLIDVENITLWLMISHIYSGYPYANMYLYVRDVNGHWEHLAMFDLDKSIAVGQPVVFPITLDHPETVTALAICPADKGVEYAAQIDTIFFVSQENVGEYSAKLPRPNFTPAGAANPVLFTTSDVQPYVDGGSNDNPFGEFSFFDAIFDAVANDDIGKYSNGKKTTSTSVFFHS